MRARHRLSKLLLRHGLVYDATAWTKAHDVWVRQQRFEAGRSRSCSTSATAGCSTRRADGTRSTRRSPSSPRRRRMSMSSSRLVCLRGVSTLTAFALTVELGDWHGSVPSRSGRFSVSPRANTQAASGADKARSPRRATARTPAADRGRLAPAQPLAQERHARAQTRRQASRGASPGRAQRSPAARTLARAREPRQAPLDRRGRGRARTRWTLLGDRDDGVAATINRSARRAHRRNDARSDPREHCERPARATPDARERHRSSFRTPGHAAPTRAYESRHRRRRQPMRSPRRTKPRTPRGE